MEHTETIQAPAGPHQVQVMTRPCFSAILPLRGRPAARDAGIATSVTLPGPPSRGRNRRRGGGPKPVTAR